MPNVNPQNGVAYKKNVHPRLSFVQYLENGASKEYQIWQQRLY